MMTSLSAMSGETIPCSVTNKLGLNKSASWGRNHATLHLDKTRFVDFRDNKPNGTDDPAVWRRDPGCCGLEGGISGP
jgi:hypothetical protein